jgi:hypothetical protein
VSGRYCTLCSGGRPNAVVPETTVLGRSIRLDSDRIEGVPTRSRSRLALLSDRINTQDADATAHDINELFRQESREPESRSLGPRAPFLKLFVIYLGISPDNDATGGC